MSIPSSFHQLGEQGIVDVVHLTPMFAGTQKAQARQGLQVHRRCLALGDASVHQKLNLGVGVPEDDLDEVFAVDGDSRASCNTMLLIRTPWLGICAASPRRLASMRLAAMACLSTALVSSSVEGGSNGRSM